MKPNVQPLGGGVFEVTDYSLFMYGLVRGDRVLTGTEGKAHYAELALWELDGVFRLGIAYVERRGVLTRLSGLVTASKVEFSVDPADGERLQRRAYVLEVIKSALRGVG